MFADRTDAGRRLAGKLSAYAERQDAIVLGIPRGGVQVGFEVAESLDAPLDVFLSRKLGVPRQEELAFGALASGGILVLDRDLIRELNISELEIERISQDVKAELQRRENAYRAGKPPLDVSGGIVLLVDDGIATGSSTLAAIKTLRQMRPAKLVLAVPVAPASTRRKLQQYVDELVCVHAPEEFFAIGQFYGDFSQISDDEVIDLLRRARQRHATDRHHQSPGTPGSEDDRLVDETSRESFPASDPPAWTQTELNSRGWRPADEGRR